MEFVSVHSCLQRANLIRTAVYRKSTRAFLLSSVLLHGCTSSCIHEPVDTYSKVWFSLKMKMLLPCLMPQSTALSSSDKCVLGWRQGQVCWPTLYVFFLSSFVSDTKKVLEEKVKLLTGARGNSPSQLLTCLLMEQNWIASGSFWWGQHGQENQP